MQHVWEYCRYLLCWLVLLGGFERSGGVAGCFKFVCLAMEVSLAAKAQLVVVSVKCLVDFGVCLLR